MILNQSNLLSSSLHSPLPKSQGPAESVDAQRLTELLEIGSIMKATLITQRVQTSPPALCINISSSRGNVWGSRDLGVSSNSVFTHEIEDIISVRPGLTIVTPATSLTVLEEASFSYRWVGGGGGLIRSVSDVC